MFYVKKLEHEIVLQPIHFGPKLKATIIRLLKEEVEGLALATYGYVVNVIEVPEDEIRSVSGLMGTRVRTGKQRHTTYIVYMSFRRFILHCCDYSLPSPRPFFLRCAGNY
mmetsp:Transcript_20691/g.42236  ORF Transcript_20691/g.42236 Transcript_20691/m.42236 type:complete len:110 (-) Transcript_20691:1226-1555(-)